MNTHIGSRLNAAALEGDIDLLYTVIQDDPSILDEIDLIPFIETPMHIAASMGHLQFATEIMTLKPSFAWKLNPQGFSPIHVAMQHNQTMMVYRFVNLNKDLVRVQGRESMTPLHFASQIGEVDLLTKFLFVCPESIKYLTVRRETALHIAVKNQQYEALQVLVRWLTKNDKEGAGKLEKEILNRRNEAGNTILHISALSSEPQALKLLVKKNSIDLNYKNLDNNTPLDIAATTEIKNILLRAGAIPEEDFVVLSHTRQLFRTMRTTNIFKILPRHIRGDDMTEAKRNTWLIVATLIATAMYASILTPPGGVYQISAGDPNNLNITSANSTLSAFGSPGTSVLDPLTFYAFSSLNMLSFGVTIIAIVIMIPSGNGIVSILVSLSIALFTFSYMTSLLWMIPEDVSAIIVLIIFGFIFLPGIFIVIYSCQTPNERSELRQSLRISNGW